MQSTEPTTTTPLANHKPPNTDTTTTHPLVNLKLPHTDTTTPPLANLKLPNTELTTTGVDTNLCHVMLLLSLNRYLFGGLLVPFCPVGNVSVLTWFMRYIYYCKLQFLIN